VALLFPYVFWDDTCDTFGFVNRIGILSSNLISKLCQLKSLYKAHFNMTRLATMRALGLWTSKYLRRLMFRYSLVVTVPICLRILLTVCFMQSWISTDDPTERGMYYLFYQYSGLGGGAVLAALVAGRRSPGSTGCR
jgi:hypothetical protein